LIDDDAEDRQAGDERYRRELGAHIPRGALFNQPSSVMN
jgi:hypothetical protein